VSKAKRKAKADNRGPLQRLHDNEQVQRDQSYLSVITPEMDAKGCYSAESRGRRYFRLRNLDRLHRNGKLTYEQHQAGAWYRDQWEMGRYDSTRTMDLTRTERGSGAVGFSERIQDARDRWREARKQIPMRLVGFADRFLLHDEWPNPLQQRHRESNLSQLKEALNVLVVHLRL